MTNKMNNHHHHQNLLSTTALFVIIISLFMNSAFAAAPANAVFSGAQLVTPTATIDFNSTDSPSTASITLCDETTIASAFMWYTIPAASYVRTISVDTCNTSFDTVLGVFSGSSYASLSVIACNDDRVSVYGDSCYPTSSFIDNINIASGEVIYVVMGGYKNTTSGIADSGVGQITFSLISGDDVPCSSALLNETQTAVINQLSSTDSSLQSDISTSQSHVDSSISSFESSIQTQFDSSSSSLETAIAGVQSTADTIQTDITTANTNLGTLQTTVDSVDSKVNTAQSTLDGDATDVSNIETQLTNLNSSMNANFTSMDNLLDTLQTSATGINSSVASAQSSVDGVQTSLNSLSTQIGTFSSDVQSSFQTTNTDISNVDSSVSSLATQLTDSSNTLNTNITNTDSQITTLHSGISNMLNTLSSLENGIQSDTSALLFYNQVDRFLSDVNAIAPDTFRIPNLYGGQMNDVANYIADTYNNLKTSALSVGTASSTACTSDAFCNYFLNTASGAYADSMAKYTTYVNALKFKTAYYYLQRAYTVLYPITW